jgi:hypothetical protein
MSYRKCLAAATAALLLFLNACGGGSGGGSGGGGGDVVVPTQLTGFTDPALPEVAALNYVYAGYAGVSPTAGDSFTPRLVLLIDASGRFYASISSARADNMPYSENVFMGTLTMAGNQLTATGVTMLYRDSASTSFSSGTVSMAGVLGPDRDVDAAGNLLLHVTFSAATVPLVANGFELEATHLGYAYPPATLPDGNYFNYTALSIDGVTGRVHGFVAGDCSIDGVMTLTMPNRNALRLRAVFSGAGCAAAGFPEATGEYLGYIFQGAVHAEGAGLDFHGIVNAKPVNFFIQSY